MFSLFEVQQAFESYLSKQAFPSSPNNLYEPCRHILSIGGKRLRPAMALLACNLFRDDIKAAFPVAYSVEIFHNFSLVHDDIMDAAPLRRGKPTVHTLFGHNAGILSGDVLLVFAFRAFEKIRDRKAADRISKVLTRVAIGVCEGQQMDMDFEQRDTVQIPEYLRMIELKTAVLLGGALEMGALAAKADPSEAEKLYHFGRLAGIAFQIQDDLLDAFGDPATFGKQVGGDILQNKKTFLVLKTLEVASASDIAALKDWFGKTEANPVEKIEAVKVIFEKNNIPALVLAEKEMYAAQAMAYLDAVDLPSERKTALRTVVAALLDRDR